MNIIDSSSLILLAKIGALDKTLDHIKEKITIPEKVYDESAKQKSTFDAKMIEERVKQKKIDQITIKNKKTYLKIKEDFSLGDGEAECITACIETNSPLITDDKRALNACKILRIKYITVPNIIVQLHKRKIVQKKEAENYLRKLEKYGRYSKEIMNLVKETLDNETNE